MSFKRLTKKQQYIASASSVALAFAFILGLYAFRGALFASAPTEGVVVSNTKASAPEIRHPLTGEVLLEAVESLPQVYAVMIDHSIDAWPQSGVDKAFLVIEAPVEAGIPRLETFFFDAEKVDKIGPIRSARPYFLDWANEFDALYVHVGGSNEALDLIGTSGIFDLNQFWNGNDFWRSTDRLAPHNVYTSTDLLAGAVAAAKEKGRAPELLYGVWKFKDAPDAPSTEEPTAPTIDFGAPAYRAVWSFDPQTDTYNRNQGGHPYVSQTGDAFSANNVAVVITDVEVVDAVGRRHVRTIGEGDAFVFQDGTVIEATWKKPSATERLRFYDKQGNEISMNAGKTWIEVVPDRSYLTF